jgi:hypothetical protein
LDRDLRIAKKGNIKIKLYLCTLKKSKNMNEIVKYNADGLDNFPVMLADETLWLTQKMMADLFQTTSQNITIHLRNIYEEQELNENATCKDFLQVRLEGSRMVERMQKFYNLDAIISVGYRIKSRLATQFRQWATQTLRDHLLNGFTLRQPATIEQLDELRFQLGEVINRLNKTDIFVHEELGKVYETLIEIAEQKSCRKANRVEELVFSLPQNARMKNVK